MQVDGWRLGDLGREARLNVFSPGSRLFPLLAIAIVVGAGISAFAAFELASLGRTLDGLAALGRNVVVFQPAVPDAPGTIDRESCEALVDEPGVERAGLVIAGSRIDIPSLGSDLQTVRSSVTLFPRLGDVDVLVGSALRAGQGQYYVAGPGLVPILAAGAAREPDALGVNSSVIVPLHDSDRAGGTCIAVLDQLAEPSLAIPALAATLTTVGNPIGAAEALPDAVDPVQAFLERPGRYFPIVLALMGAVAAGLVGRLRSSEIAVYRLSGSTTRSVLALLSLESLLIAGCLALASVTTSILLWPYVDTLVPMLWGILSAGCWAVGSMALTADLAFRRPTDLAKDR